MATFLVEISIQIKISSNYHYVCSNLWVRMQFPVNSKFQGEKNTKSVIDFYKHFSEAGTIH